MHADNAKEDLVQGEAPGQPTQAAAATQAAPEPQQPYRSGKPHFVISTPPAATQQRVPRGGTKAACARRAAPGVQPLTLIKSRVT